MKMALLCSSRNLNLNLEFEAVSAICTGQSTGLARRNVQSPGCEARNNPSTHVRFEMGTKGTHLAIKLTSSSSITM